MGVVAVVVAVLIGVPTLFVTFWSFLQTRTNRLRDDLGYVAYRRDWAKSLTPGGERGARYPQSVQRRSDGWDRFFGPRLLSFRAFDRCLLIAFVYPILLFVGAWALGGTHQMAGEDFLPDVEHGWPRIWRTGLLLGLAIGAFLWLRICWD